MGTITITIDDIRQANAQVTGSIKKPVLSDEDKVLLSQIKRVVGPVKDGPQLRKLYKKAASH